MCGVVCEIPRTGPLELLKPVQWPHPVGSVFGRLWRGHGSRHFLLARLVLALLIVGAHGGSGDVRVFYECVSSVSTFLWAFVRVLHVLHPQFHNSRCSTTTADTITAGLDGGDYDGGDDDNNDNNSGGRAIFRNVKQSNNSCSRVTSRRQYYIR